MIYIYTYMHMYIKKYVPFFPLNTPFTSIWVWVKIRYPNNWMVNTTLD